MRKGNFLFKGSWNDFNQKGWLVSIVVLLLVVILSGLGGFQRLDMSLYDNWFRWRGITHPGNDVVIIAIDEPSIEKIGSFPWQRSLYSKLLDQLKAAKTVGFDLIFDIPTLPSEDNQFVEAVARHGKVVLASSFSFHELGNGEIEQIQSPLLPALRATIAGLGFVNIPTDNDGVVRRVTLIDMNTLAEPLPSFGLGVWMVANKLNPSQLKITNQGLQAGLKQVPMNNLNQSLLNFYGPKGTFPTYSFVDVIGGKVSPEVFKDKIVLVGVTAASLKDYFSTPFTTSNLVKSGALPTPGVEIHASIVQSFLDNYWYKKVQSLMDLGILVAISILVVVTVRGRGPWYGLIGVIGVAGLTVIVNYQLWRHAHLWSNLAVPLTLILLNYVLITANDFVYSEIGRKRAKTMFSRYLSPDLVEELTQNNKELTLGGMKQQATIMFCDIRNFTTYSEERNAEDVINRLNEYLTAMTRIIFQHGGTLDKYLGDGLMASFGVPLYSDQHAEQALASAIAIQKAIDELNRTWKMKHREPAFGIGIGINSGEVLVGNVGSPERMDYTVMGTVVNLAARFEECNKKFDTSIILGESTAELLMEKEFTGNELLPLGPVEIRGFSRGVNIYTVRKE